MVHFGSHELKLLLELDIVETDFLEYMEDFWAKEKIVTRNIIFREVLELDPNFLGGVGSFNHMEKLKNWFYYGLKQQENIFIRNIFSVGQKNHT